MIKNVKNFTIRLSLLFISIIGLYFCNNVNAVYRSDPDYIRQIWVYWYSPYTQSMSINVLRSWLPLTQALWLTKNFFYFEDNVYWWWGYRGTPYVYRWNDCQWYVLSYKICTPIISGNNNPSDCSSTINITSWSSANFKAFFDTMTTEDYYYFHKGGADYGTTWNFCFSSVAANSSLCFDWSNCNLGDSLGYSWVNFDTFENYWWDNNPWSSSQGGWSGSGSNNNSDNSLIYTQWNDLDNTISYFENQFGRNVNMCYVGTNNLTWVYGTAWIDFQYWQWDTIFWLFNSLYGGFWDNIIQNVWRFINTWLINYSQWFATAPWNRLYLAKYDWPWNNVTYYYTWLTFPYANQPVAIYFMSDLLYNEYSIESTLWESMSYYCYLKFNYNELKTGTWSQTFEDVQDMVTPWIVWRVNDYVNVYLSGHVWFLVPDYSWSIWGDVTSWSVFDWDVDPSNTFEGFYNDILWIVNRWNYSWSGILPPWIIYPLLFLILFRILKH